MLSARTMDASVTAACMKCIETIRRYPSDSAWFEEPVLNQHAPRYSVIIRQPMELRTIFSNLITPGTYLCALDFISDVGLMLRNAMVYNTMKRGDIRVRDSALRLAQVFQAAVHAEMGALAGAWASMSHLPPPTADKARKLLKNELAGRGVSAAHALISQPVDVELWPTYTTLVLQAHSNIAHQTLAL